MNNASLRAWRMAAMVAAVASAWAVPAAARDLSAIDALARAPKADTTAKSASLAALQSAHPDVAIDPRLSVPTFLWAAQATSALQAQGRTLTPKAARDEEASARAYLRDVAALEGAACECYRVVRGLTDRASDS